MTTSNALTQTDLENILNEVLPCTSKVDWVYDSTVNSSNVYSNSWVAPANGVALVQATWDTTQNFGYWYLQDSTQNIQVAQIGGTANGTSESCMIPILKGHTYESVGHDHVYYARFYYFKFVEPTATVNKDILDWTYVGTATGTATVSLPADWKEIMVVGKFGANGAYGFTEYFIRNQIETYASPNRFFGGNCTNPANDYHGYWLQLTTTSVALGGWNWSGTNYASTSTIYVYSR